MGGKLQPSNRTSTFFVGWYTLMVFWWLWMNAYHALDSNSSYLFGLVYGLIPIVGGVIGCVNAKRWGMLQSAMGQACLFLSLGMITWGLGNQIWAYYNFAQAIDVPYPSWADLAYVASWPLWAIGVIRLSRATGVQFSLRRLQGKIQLFIVPILVGVLSYHFLVTVARAGVLIPLGDFWTKFFDLAYPLGDLVILTLATLVFGLSFRQLGGRYKLPILLILFGFVLNYAGDVSFVWSVTHDLFSTGDWVDLLYATTMTVLTLGITGLDPRAALLSAKKT